MKNQLPAAELHNVTDGGGEAEPGQLCQVSGEDKPEQPPAAVPDQLPAAELHNVTVGGGEAEPG